MQDTLRYVIFHKKMELALYTKKEGGGYIKCSTIPTYTHPSNAHSPPAGNLNYHSNTPQALLGRPSI